MSALHAALQGAHPVLLRVGQIMDVSGDVARSNLARVAAVVESTDVGNDWALVGAKLSRALKELAAQNLDEASHKKDSVVSE